MKTLVLQALVREEDADDLLLELAGDPRVTAAFVELGDSKYRVPDHAALAPADEQERR